MPARDWRMRVQDILDAIADIESHVAGMTFQPFAADRRTIQAVLYNSGVIGEAVSTLPDDVKERHPHVPWRDIRDMRNVVTHVYFGIDLSRVWGVTQHRMAPLRAQL